MIAHVSTIRTRCAMFDPTNAVFSKISYLEELIRSPTSEYAYELLNSDGDEVRRKTGKSLIDSGRTENPNNDEYLVSLEAVKKYSEHSSPLDRSGRERPADVMSPAGSILSSSARQSNSPPSKPCFQAHPLACHFLGARGGLVYRFINPSTIPVTSSRTEHPAKANGSRAMRGMWFFAHGDPPRMGWERANGISLSSQRAEAPSPSLGRRSRGRGWRGPGRRGRQG